MTSREVDKILLEKPKLSFFEFGLLLSFRDLFKAIFHYLVYTFVVIGFTLLVLFLGQISPVLAIVISVLNFVFYSGYIYYSKFSESKRLADFSSFFLGFRNLKNLVRLGTLSTCLSLAVNGLVMSLLSEYSLGGSIEDLTRLISSNPDFSRSVIMIGVVSSLIQLFFIMCLPIYVNNPKIKFVDGIRLSVNLVLNNFVQFLAFYIVVFAVIIFSLFLFVLPVLFTFPLIFISQRVIYDLFFKQEEIESLLT